MFIASGAYTGYLPKAPGTWGSLVGVALWAAVHDLSPVTYISLVAASFIIGTFCAGSAEKIIDRADPGIVVIDEIVGQLIALALAPFSLAAAVIGFALFRAFDIIKPFPINWVDKHLHGGLGIMLDDIFAGLYALVILQLILKYIWP